MKGGLLGAVVGGLGGAAAGVAIARKKLLKKNDEIQRLKEQIQKLEGAIPTELGWRSWNQVLEEHKGVEKTHRAEIEAKKKEIELLELDKRTIKDELDEAKKLAEAAYVSSTDEDDAAGADFLRMVNEAGLDDDTVELQETHIDTLKAEHTAKLQALREQHSEEMKKQKETNDLKMNRIEVQHSENQNRREKITKTEHAAAMAETVRLKEEEHHEKMNEASGAARLKEEEHAAEMADELDEAARAQQVTHREEMTEQRKHMEQVQSDLKRKHREEMTDKDRQHVDDMKALTEQCKKKMRRTPVQATVRKGVGRTQGSPPKVPSNLPQKMPAMVKLAPGKKDGREEAKQRARAKAQQKRDAKTAEVLQKLRQTDTDKVDPN